MTVGIKSGTSIWSRANALNSPIMIGAKRETCVGEYIFGVDAAASVINYANPAAPLTIQGTPTYGANSATVRSSFTDGYGFKSGIVPALGFTLILVRKNAAIASIPMLAGMNDAGSEVFGLRQFGVDNYMSAGDAVYTAGPKRTRPASGSTVYLEMVTHVPHGKTVARYGAGGVLTNVVSATDTNINSRMKTNNTDAWFTEVCFGSNSLSDSITNNSAEMFYAAIVNDEFSDGEADELYQNIIDYYAARSVTVV